MEKRESDAASMKERAKNFYASGQYNEIVSSCWADSARRQCLPSVMRADPSHSRRVPSLPPVLSLTAGAGQPPLPRVHFPDTAASVVDASGHEAPSAWNMSPPTSPPAGPARAPGARPQSSELHHAIKVALGKRWRPYANGAIRRYNVLSRVRGGPGNGDGGQECNFRFIEEMARRHADAQAEKRLPHDVFAPQAPPPRQFIVRPPDVDSRRVADEVNAKPKTLANAEIPTEIRHRKVLFDATLGAVKPYALGEAEDRARRQRGGRRPRPGEVAISMPMSALSRDPLEVFVEAMRYQRPALGIYTFDVY